MVKESIPTTPKKSVKDDALGFKETLKDEVVTPNQETPVVVPTVVKEGETVIKTENSVQDGPGNAETKPKELLENNDAEDSKTNTSVSTEGLSKAEIRRMKRKSKWTQATKREGGFTTKTPAEIQADLLAQHQQAAAASALANQQQRNRIYIGSLDFSLSEVDMKEIFQAFGEITNIDMPKEGNRSKGYCFIEFALPEMADMALQTMQNFTLKGRIIKVGRPTASNIAPALPPALQGISNFAPGSGQVPGGIQQNQQPAQMGVTTLGNGVLSGTTTMPVTVTGGQDMNRIYIGNVPYTFTAEDIRKIFTVFGTILSCQLIPSAENPGTHRGYGFLEFSTNAEAKIAIETMNGFEVQGKALKVNYSTQLHSRPAVNQPSNNVAPVNQMNSMPAVPPTTNLPSTFTGVMGGPVVAAPPTGFMGSVVKTGGVTGSNLSPLGTAGGATGYERSPGGVSPGVNVAAPVTSSSVILMTNMINPSEIDREFPQEVRTETSKYGEVEDVRIQIVNNEVRVFVKFSTATCACSAVPALNGRWFSGRMIKCKLYNQEVFEAGNYEL